MVFSCRKQPSPKAIVAISMTFLEQGNRENPSGFINSRLLDDKTRVATLLPAAKSLTEKGEKPPLDCHLLFTISEEVGVSASHDYEQTHIHSLRAVAPSGCRLYRFTTAFLSRQECFWFGKTIPAVRGEN